MVMTPHERFRREQQFLAERGDDRWFNRYVLPFYADWMGTNAGSSRDMLTTMRAVRARALELSVDEIATMLTIGWRIQVMGAWYAVARADRALLRPVLEAWDYCDGDLTSPPFAVAGLLLGDDPDLAGMAMAEYRLRASDPWASFAIVDEVLVRRGVLHRDDVPDWAGPTLDLMLNVGRRLPHC